MKTVKETIALDANTVAGLTKVFEALVQQYPRTDPASMIVGGLK